MTKKKINVQGTEIILFKKKEEDYISFWSGRQDSNLRPHGPKPRTLAN